MCVKGHKQLKLDLIKSLLMTGKKAPGSVMMLEIDRDLKVVILI